MTRVRGSHQVLCVEHLLRELRHSDSTVTLRASRCQRRKADHEEVQSRERHHVDGELPQVRVELTGESEGGGDTGHDEGDEVVKVAVGGRGEFEGPGADIVQSLVVDAEGFVRVLDELVD